MEEKEIYIEKFDFSSLQNRMKSFKDWPQSNCQKPRDLASAGFFYIGINDQVECYACGGGLKDWEIDDKPWDEHALWYGNCMFVKLNKGDIFVKEVKKEYELRNNSVLNKIIHQKENSFETHDNKHLCKICFTNELNMIFIPCMHVITCESCTLQIQKCPICRERIDKCKRIYFS